MAYYGLAMPLIAKLNEATGTYSDGFQCGTAVGTDITPNYAEGSLYGDNTMQEYEKEFRDADITLNVTALPSEASEVMFGHEINAETGEVVHKGQDQANYVGYGFCVREKINGSMSYTAAVLPKCKFSTPAESYTTRGENIEFKTPSITGKVMANPNGEWKFKNTFGTEGAALNYLGEKLNMSVTIAREGWHSVTMAKYNWKSV